MTRFYRRHVQPHVERWVPSAISANYHTLLFVVAIAALVWFAYSIHETSLKAERAAKEAKAATTENRRLGLQNRHLIREQQTSRIVSCRKTYEAFNEVFKPFFPPKKHRTARQQSDLDKLHSTIDDLKARCAKQTATKGTS